ncbi:MAG: hypothetical protein QXQ13_05335 [Thermoplasmata archaeon]
MTPEKLRRKMRTAVVPVSPISEERLAQLRQDGVLGPISEGEIVELGFEVIAGDPVDNGFISKMMDEELERRKKKLRTELAVLEKKRKDYEEMQRYYEEYLKAEEKVERALIKTQSQIDEMLRLIKAKEKGGIRGDQG